MLAGIANSEAKLTQQTDRLSLYRRTWKLAPVVASTASAVGPWLLFRDSLGIADELATKLKSTGQQAILVDVGDSYRQLKKNRYKLRPAVRADYDALIADLIAAGEMPKQIIHLWSLTPASAEPPLDESLERSFLSPLYLAQALAAQDLEGISIAFVSERMQQVTDEPVPNPARAVLLGPARVIPRELPGISTRAIDLSSDDEKAADSAAHLVAEMSAADPHTTSAWRNGERYVESLDLLDSLGRLTAFGSNPAAFTSLLEASAHWASRSLNTWLASSRLVSSSSADLHCRPPQNGMAPSRIPPSLKQKRGASAGSLRFANSLEDCS